MKKAPISRGLKSKLDRVLLLGRRELLLFLRSSFLLRGFLGCVLHRLILPNIKFCDLKNRNVIHL